MGAFDPLIPWPTPKREEDSKPVDPPQPPSPNKRIPIGPTDI